jgi:hypothetical protein
MNLWRFAFAFSACVALVLINVGGAAGQFAGCFILGGVFGTMLYRLLEEGEP